MIDASKNMDRGIVLVAALIMAASLALRAAFPIVAAANAGHDDALFVKLAASLMAGEWLGPYDNLTHAKGVGYPAFIALASFAHVPLKIAEHVAYLAASALFSWVVSSLLRSRAAGLACLAVLALNPMSWSADSGGRVIRECVYVSLTLAIVALAALAFLDGRADKSSRERWVVGVALGALGGAFWLTREEGAWLAPSIAILVVAWASRVRREWRRHIPTLVIPLAAFGLVVGAVDLENYRRYGVFRNNDFRSGEFPQAYGALSRIAHDAAQPYVLFPADARRKAYAASPAARELAQTFEGQHGENYRALSCYMTATPAPCLEIRAGWFMWILRDAVDAAGHYTTAQEARGFYRRLAREVNAACDRGEIPCGPRSDSLVPPWRSEYGPRIVSESLRTLGVLATLGDVHVIRKPSLGTEEQLALFARITRDRQAGVGDRDKPIDPGLQALAAGIARVEVRAMPGLFAAAFAASIGLAGVAWRRRRWHAGLTLLVALWVAVAMRVGLLGFLAATSLPANDLPYLTPVMPVALVLAPFVLFLAIDMRRETPGGSFHA